MKPIIIGIVCCLILSFFPPPSFAGAREDVRTGEIRIRNGESGKTVIFPENKKIKVWLANGTILKGRFAIESKDAIRINNQTVLLSEITQLRVPRRSTQIIGGLLGIPGAFITALGLALLTNYGGNPTDPEGLFSLIFGLLLLIVGGIPLLIGFPLMFVGKKFNLLTKWTMSVLEENPIQKT